MPNWVYNQLTVSGERHEVDMFVQKASASAIDWMTEDDRDAELSFANFIRPSDPEGYRNGGWYQWNIDNWGTKWDATRVERSDEGDSVSYTFDTAWSPPEPVFHAMVEQFPRLDFEMHYLEEQGWGGELAGRGGIYWIIKQWDIPDTHADSMENKGWCYCEENDEVEYMYADCPKAVASREVAV